MKTPAQPPVLSEMRRPSTARWLWLLPVPVLAVALPLGLLVIGATGCFRVGGDAATLRRSVAQSAAADVDCTVEVRVSALLCGLVRGGLSLADVPLDPEARAALDTLHGGEVGVYELRPRGDCNRAAVLRAADKSMRGRGWDRMVGVLHGDDLVAVYVPQKMRSGRDCRVCVLVMADRHMVVVSARGNPEPLLQLALEHADFERKSAHRETPVGKTGA